MHRQTVNEIHHQTGCHAHENQKQAVTTTKDERPPILLPVAFVARR